MKNLLNKIISSKKEIFVNNSGEKILAEVIETAKYLWNRGWAESNAGNISINLTDIISEEFKIHSLSKTADLIELESNYQELKNNFFLITCAGKRMRDLPKEPENSVLIIKISEDGKNYSIISDNIKINKCLKPTSELAAHLEIHKLLIKRNSPNKVILHTHPTELIAITQIEKFANEENFNKLMWSMHPESAMIIPEGVGFANYLMPGTKEIAEVTVKLFEKHSIAVWEKHGCFAIGKDLSEAFDRIDAVQKSSTIYLKCKMSGHEPTGLKEKDINDLCLKFKKEI